jgi:excisionase family DNA binding protein
MEKDMNGNLMTTHEAAKYLNVSKAFLERDRWSGARIPFIKVGSRAVRYRLADLEAFVEAQIRQSTGDEGI